MSDDANLVAARRAEAARLGLRIAEEIPTHERNEGFGAVSLEYGRGTWVRSGGGVMCFRLHGKEDAANYREIRVLTPAEVVSDAVVESIEAAAAQVAGRTSAVNATAVVDSESPLLDVFADACETARAQRDAEIAARNTGSVPPARPVVPFVSIGQRFRNGRETGAFAAGVALLAGKVNVQLARDHVDGAVTALVAAGCGVRHMTGSHKSGWHTLEVTSEKPSDIGYAWARNDPDPE